MLDSFGNEIDPTVDYARGKILASSVDEKIKYQKALHVIKERAKLHGEQSFYIFTGNMRNNNMLPTDLAIMSEEWVGQGLFLDDLRTAGIAHVGGNPEKDDVAVFNRTSAANVATALALGGVGKNLVSFAPQKKHHPSVVRGAALSQSTLLSVASAEELRALPVTGDNAFCFITSVTSELLYFNEEEMREGIEVAMEKGMTIVVDDAYGARVRPILYGFTPALQAGAHAVITNNDKAGLNGPRAGIMVGEPGLVTRIHSKACELGLEARAPISLAVLRSLNSFSDEDLKGEVAVGKEMYTALSALLGEENVHASLLGPEVTAETLLRLMLERSGVAKESIAIVPAEATSAMGMELLARFGIVTTNACGMPGARVSLRLKTNRETMQRIGGAGEVAQMFVTAMDAVGAYVQDFEQVKKMLVP